MELVFAFLAGLLTLINPCVVPVLPLVLGTALNASRLGPIALAAGMSLVFVLVGVVVTAFGHVVGLDDQIIAQAGAAFMVIFGVVLLVPQLSSRFALATGGVASGADDVLDDVDRTSLWGQFLGGMLLGAVWSPCVGPTLGGAIALASTGESLGWATLIMISFALGVSSIILALAYGARSTLQKRQAVMRRLATHARPIMGVIFIIVGIALLFGVHKMIESWALDALPIWIQDLSVRF